MNLEFGHWEKQRIWYLKYFKTTFVAVPNVVNFWKPLQAVKWDQCFIVAARILLRPPFPGLEIPGLPCLGTWTELPGEPAFHGKGT